MAQNVGLALTPLMVGGILDNNIDDIEVGFLQMNYLMGAFNMISVLLVIVWIFKYKSY